MSRLYCYRHCSRKHAWLQSFWPLGCPLVRVWCRGGRTPRWTRRSMPPEGAVRAVMAGGHTDVVSAAPLLTMLRALRLAGDDAGRERPEVEAANQAPADDSGLTRRRDE